jgi:hypothetical protein
MKIYKYIVFFYTLTIVTGISGILIPLRLPYKEYYIWSFLIILLWNFTKKVSFDPKLIRLTFFTFAFYFLTLCLSILDGTSGFLQWLVFINFTVYSVAVSRKNVFDFVVKKYLLLSKLLICTFLLVFVADLINIISYENLHLPRGFDQGFWNKYAIKGNSDVYGIFAGFFVIMKDYVKPIFILNNIGTYCGMSYEPHLYGFMITPAVFMLSRLPKGNYWFFAGFGTLLLAFSLTNLLAFLLAVFFLKGLKAFKFLVISGLVSTYYFLYKYITPIIAWFEAKRNSRSADDIGDTSNFFLEVKTLFGGGLWAYLDSSSSDIGWITVVMILFVVLFLIIKSASRIKLNGAGVSITIYLLIHSSKFPVNVFFLPFLFFLVAIIAVYDERVFQKNITG